MISFYHGRLSFITIKSQNLITRSLDKKPILVPLQAKNAYAGFTFSGNVGKLLAHLVGKPEALGEVFTLGGVEDITWEEIGKYITQELGSNFVWVDKSVFLENTTPKSQAEYYGLEQDRLIDRRVDISKAIQVTGLKNSDFIPMKEAIAQEVKIILSSEKIIEEAYKTAPKDYEDNMDKYFQNKGERQ